MKSQSSAWKNVFAVFKREFFSYFNSPVAYVIIVIFLVLSQGLTFTISNLLGSDDANLTGSFFVWHPWIYMVLAPAVGMKLWSEEHRLGTLELLMTMPISPWQGIVGKYLAASVIWAIGLALTFPVVITIFYLGSPDPGPVISAYFASFLYAISCLAVTCAVSAFTRSQVICFIISVALCFVITMLGSPAAADWLGKVLPYSWDWLLHSITYLSFMTHFYDLSKGVLVMRDLVFFGSVIAVCLMVTALGLQSKRA